MMVYHAGNTNCFFFPKQIVFKKKLMTWGNTHDKCKRAAKVYIQSHPKSFYTHTHTNIHTWTYIHGVTWSGRK